MKAVLMRKQYCHFKAEMRALKQAGLAEVQIESLVNGVIDIVVNAALAAIP
jgi:hypothetical protein